jgi:cytochrome c oxidase subunit 4
MSAGVRTSLRALVVTWAALLGLAGLSFALSFAHLGALALPAALAVAVAKAALVAAVFMELRAAGFVARLALVVAAGFIALLVGLMSADVATREAPPLRPAPADQAL